MVGHLSLSLSFSHTHICVGYFVIWDAKEMKAIAKVDIPSPKQDYCYYFAFSPRYIFSATDGPSISVSLINHPLLYNNNNFLIRSLNGTPQKAQSHLLPHWIMVAVSQVYQATTIM